MIRQTWTRRLVWTTLLLIAAAMLLAAIGSAATSASSGSDASVTINGETREISVGDVIATTIRDHRTNECGAIPEHEIQIANSINHIELFADPQTCSLQVIGIGNWDGDVLQSSGGIQKWRVSATAQIEDTVDLPLARSRTRFEFNALHDGGPITNGRNRQDHCTAFWFTGWRKLSCLDQGQNLTSSHYMWTKLKGNFKWIVTGSRYWTKVQAKAYGYVPRQNRVSASCWFSGYPWGTRSDCFFELTWRGSA